MKFLTFLAVVVLNVEGLDRVCYEHLGCFSMRKPWLSADRPVPAPDPPSSLKIRAIYYNRDNPDDGVVVTTWPKINLHNALFDYRKRTFFLNHGYQTAGTDTWIQHLKLGLLNRFDANVFIGDWGMGAKNVDYFQAVGNLRVAARQFSNLLHYLVDQEKLNVSTLHLIGHSLGGQMCGYIGKSIKGIYRITALDAAQPCFEGYGPQVKLTRDDAIYVEAVHADARPFIPDMGFGFMNPIANIDYYINGGHGQPGCSFPKLTEIPRIKSLTDFASIPTQLLVQTLLCPHGLSHEFFTEAVTHTDCIFWGHNATIQNMLRGISNAAFEGFFSKYLGITDECTYASCSPMGMDSFEWPARGSFVVNTRGNFPYCIYEAALVPVEDQERFAIKFQKWFFKAIKP